VRAVGPARSAALAAETQVPGVEDGDWVLLDTRWACAVVVCKGGVVVRAAPIYQCFVGQRLVDILRRGASKKYRILG
jgi:hypothetical protein